MGLWAGADGVDADIIGAIVALSPLAHLAGYRPCQLRWGATAGEVSARFPGDGILPRPQWSATRAVTIGAPVEDVWPWLEQMGAGDRAGWYRYDVIDNGCVPSATEIRPDWRLKDGDTARLTAGSPAGFRVESIDPGRSIVFAYRERNGTVTAAFVLLASGAGRRRLLHRVRFRVRPTPAALVWAALMDAGDFVMSRRMLLGIRARAESSSRGNPRLDATGQPRRSSAARGRWRGSGASHPSPPE